MGNWGGKLLELFASAVPLPAEEAERHERGELVQCALAASSRLDQLVVRLRVESGLPFAEIAPLVGLCSAVAAESQYRRALERLTARLTEMAPEFAGR